MIESNTLKATLKIFILQALIFIPIISIAQPSENIGFVIEASGKSKEVVEVNAKNNAITLISRLLINENDSDSLTYRKLNQRLTEAVFSQKLIFEFQNNDSSLNCSYYISFNSAELFTAFNYDSSLKENALKGFLMKAKLNAFLETTEVLTIRTAIKRVDEILKKSFDFNLLVGEPKLNSSSTQSNWVIPLSISINTNSNIKSATDYLSVILKFLLLDSYTQQDYKSYNKENYTVVIDSIEYYLRSKMSFEMLQLLYMHWKDYLSRFQLKLNDEFINVNLKQFNVKDIGVRDALGRSDGISRELIMRGVSFNFPKPDENVGFFLYEDLKSLKEIESIKQYSVYPKPSNLKYTIGEFSIPQGGIVVWLSSDSSEGMVIPSSIKLRKNTNAEFFWDPNWNEYRSELDNEGFANTKSLNGYEDWTIPTLKQMILIRDNIYLKGYDKFEDRRSYGYKKYSNTDDEMEKLFYFYDGKTKTEFKREQTYVRPIRIFK